MNYDLEHFTEFLADPSAVDINEFYVLFRRWGEYVIAHKGEFDFVHDAEWQEVRARLGVEYKKREVLRKEIDAEWEKTVVVLDNIENANYRDVFEAMKGQLAIMKAYQQLFEFTDEDITLLEKDIEDYSQEIRKWQTAQAQIGMANIALQNSIADLDESLAKYQERTGKTPAIPFYPDKKDKKGN